MKKEDIKKLKVTELREALKERGLETKGNKPVLIKRLERAVAAEAGEDVVDESMNESYETANDDSVIDTSQDAIQISDDDKEKTQEQRNESETAQVISDDDKEKTQEQRNESETAQVVEDEPESTPPVEETEPPKEESPPAEQEPIETESVKETTQEEPQVIEDDDVVAVEPNMTEEEPMQTNEKDAAEVETKEEPEVQVIADETAVKEEELGEKKDVKEERTESDEKEQKMETEDNKEVKTEQTVGPDGEVLQVVDSVGEVDVIPVVDKDDGSRKRRRSRSRSPHRRHRSRHSRSRSPRRRSRSAERKRRSGSKERRERSGSRDRYGRAKARDSYQQRKEPEEADDWINATNVQFDKFNCDLHIRIKDDGYKCNPITVEGFAFMWAGVRSNYGVTKGKIAYECKILEHLNVDHLPEEEKTRHVVRLGFSTDQSTMQLGEEKLSYGYGGTSKASTECKFKDFGEKFGEGDVIGVYLDMDSDPMTISYSKNGKDLGVCFEIERTDLDNQALFPHVLTKNSEFEVNFGQMEKPFFELKEGYAFINDVPETERVRGTKPLAKKEDCEMIMMCGLPGAGKTYWATKYSQEHPEKRYNVLGTNNIIDKMKVMGLPRKGNYSGRWDTLIDKSTKCLTRLLEIASKKKRNYILDQTNVYPTAQRRKMRPFEGFQRRAVVIVPTDEVFKERCEKREKEEGKEIPDNAVWEMKANFQLPEEGQCFDKVEFVELDKDEAKKLVEKYNKEGSDNLPPDYKRYNRGPDRYADRDRNRSYSGGYYQRDNRDRYHTDHRSSRGGNRYMGYSNNDRQRADRYNDRGDRDRYSRDSGRSGGRSYSGGSSYGGSSSGYNNNYNSSSGSGGWGNQSQSGWGNQSQGSWGNPGWGSQGWGNQGYSGSQGWGGYNQQQQSGQGWGGQGYYGSWGNYYGNQQGGWGGYSGSH